MTKHDVTREIELLKSLGFSEKEIADRLCVALKELKCYIFLEEKSIKLDSDKRYYLEVFKTKPHNRTPLQRA